MIDLLQKIGTLGKRLADAGREARLVTTSMAGEATDQVTQAIGAAAGEVIRAAVIGAVATVVRGVPKPASPRFSPSRFPDTWDDAESLKPEDAESNLGEANPSIDEVLPLSEQPRWASATRAVGTALTVAAGAAASVPGGRLVAAGLGGLAAVAALAVRAAEKPNA